MCVPPKFCVEALVLSVMVFGGDQVFWEVIG